MESIFSSNDMTTLTDAVADAWARGAGLDWSVPAGTLEWSCLRTADHAVDTVMAPAHFLASRQTGGYPDWGWSFTMDDRATPELLVDGLRTATRFLVAVVAAAEAEGGVRAVIWLRPSVAVRPPEDFLPRGGLELILHAHDVCAGLGVPFDPPAGLCRRLREHTRSWPMWRAWSEPAASDDPWDDLLRASGRRRQGT